MKRFKKVITMLNIVEKQQKLKALDKFIHSPYFDIHPYSAALFNYLKSQLNTKKTLLLNTSAIAAKEKALKTKSIQDKAGTLLLNDIIKFAAIEQLNTDVRAYNIAQLKILSDPLWSEINEQIEAQVNERLLAMEHNLDYYGHIHYIEEVKINTPLGKIDRAKQTDANKVIETFDLYYNIKRLRYLCEALNRHTVTNEQNIGEARSLIEKLKTHTTNEHPYIYIFVHAIQMLIADTYTVSASHYNTIKHYIDTAPTIALHDAKNEVVNYMQSHSIKWGNKGETEANESYLWCIAYKIQHGIFEKSAVVDAVVYYNIFNLAYKTKLPAAKIEMFIDKLSPLLHQPQKVSRIKFAKGILEMSRTNYKSAVDYFEDAETGTEPIFDIALKRWRFIAKYEHDNEDESLDNTIVALERFIQRKELHESIKIQFVQFVKYAKKLVYKPRGNNAAKLLAELNKEPFFTCKEWLCEKTSALGIKKSRT